MIATTIAMDFCQTVTPSEIATVIDSYARGWFLMADEDSSDLGWYRSRDRCLIPLDNRFRYPRSLRRVLNQQRFEFAISRDFLGTIAGCADRPSTWISDELAEIYQQLQRYGWALSWEAWQGDRLVGGILGVAIGSLFIGESMFYHEPEASKAALVTLVQALQQGGWQVFDVQLTNPHLERFGSFCVSDRQYSAQIQTAIARPAKLVTPTGDRFASQPHSSAASDHG
ncbi:leucyl/phenylalanyl-tRNA--protein transferase [Synechococcus elongatus]|uniref:Leucyl/phenylalanyl-tRNA--protein transferase n=1 Tax=Synechococcus elongatus (strain ATCC 33912 / PCC 7942 / FACHB-805) TaxID=1140 RepID=Q31QN1_SYNE7|nr:leucyl/phenylalanyl-tRNA--protein transferase [Synechococcus elongatus PCC 7942 = FACHB-805]AJD58817.1 leucyl/phenylalanyl-tRNA--protein transferase [Synechococcus elongatus UTEX 2973]MBD2588982.1 leucyl/phenylalanyl-tRNA--protein transferase [Synechococcus elongatus FACHB-242]MBD2690048.1 leucyl/phenylalanyl-tRNA--protein transferase [Synechococcus elongatus FACHB-1061]UOW70398.1 leucyl/phenylalanyl-tRNA--protein transferase [Synechococcus elongatus PCC 7943]UOW73119.1 leucyl/phenylalanyl-